MVALKKGFLNFLFYTCSIVHGVIPAFLTNYRKSAIRNAVLRDKILAQFLDNFLFYTWSIVHDVLPAFLTNVASRP